jgi:predicted ATPase
MITKVAFTRFRGFSAATVELNPLSVVLGPNSSGKTSVLHAIRLAAAALRAAIEDETAVPSVDGDIVHMCSNLIVRDHTRLMRVGEWAEIFSGRQIGEGIDAEIVVDFDAASPVQRLVVKLAYARNAVLKMSVSATSKSVAAAVAGIPKKSVKRPAAIRDELKKVRPLAVLVPAFYGVILAEEYRSKAVTAQLLEGGEQSRIVRNLVARLDPLAFERLNAFLLATVGTRLTYCTSPAELENREHLEVRFSDGSGDLELCSAGAGLVNLIALFSALERFRTERIANQSLVFLLDEPEAHLHPRLQGDAGVAIADLVGQFGAQLIMATHSVEMINRLGVRDGTALIQMDRAKSTATQLKTENEIVKGLSAWCDLTPFGSINFLASRRILFHEGPTDETVLSKCAEACFKSDPAKLKQFGRWTLVPLDGVGNAGAAEVLAKTLSPKLFPTLTGGQKVQVVRVLDRDATRTPGTSTKPGKTVIETQIVWSAYSIESLFLTPECIAAWLAPAIGDASHDEASLAALAKDAIAAADEDQALEDFAIDQLSIHLRKTVAPAEVVKQAREEARKSPAVWQQGRERAKFILKHIRAKLPAHLQNRVRGSLPSALEAVAAIKTGNLDVLVPAEVRKLLDSMVA